MQRYFLHHLHFPIFDFVALGSRTLCACDMGDVLRIGGRRMTIDEAIRHCRDTALSNAGYAIAYLKGGQKILAELCEECAAPPESEVQEE